MLFNVFGRSCSKAFREYRSRLHLSHCSMFSIPELSFPLFQLSLEEQSICTDVFAVMSMSRKEGSVAFCYGVCSILLAGRSHFHKTLFLSLSREMRPENSVAL